MELPEPIKSDESQEEEEEEEENEKKIEHNKTCECCNKNTKLFKQIMRKINSSRNNRRRIGIHRISKL